MLLRTTVTHLSALALLCGWYVAAAQGFVSRWYAFERFFGSYRLLGVYF